MNMENGVHYRQWSKTGQPLHFFGANGFPTGCYQQSLAMLAQNYAVTSLHNRATWPNTEVPKKLNWKIYAQDLIHFLDHHVGEPVIGVGHSMGATATVFAANQRPDLFKKLVLIEPAMASPWLARLLPLLPFKLKKNIQPIKYTVNKPQHWASKADFFNDCRQRNVFKRINDHNLNLLAEHSLVADGDNGLRLAFPKLWEARNYASAPSLYKQLSNVNVPVVAIRGKPSLYFTEKSWQKWQSFDGQHQFLENANYGHLMPLESPEDCVALIEQGLANIKQ